MAKETGLHAAPWRWWRSHVVGSVDHVGIVRRVRAEARFNGRFAFLVVISVLISILGLLLPSSAVLIGAMLISPLMMPIIGLGFSIATFDLAEMRDTAFALAVGAVLAVLLSAAFVAVSPVQTVTTEIAIRTKPNLFDLLVALLSAIAGAYALIRGRGETVVGVAIAIALMPPLAVVGFGIATLNWTAASGAMLLFLTNLVTIALTVALMARLYGFGAHLSPAQTRLQGFLIVVGLLALAVPLGLALRQIAWESVAQRQVREAVRAPFPRGARLSQLDIDFARTPFGIRAVVLTPELRSDADARARAAATAVLGAPVDLHIDQVRVGAESGTTEAAQIAAAQDGEVDRYGGDVRDRLALIAGVPAEAVIADAATRRAEVRAAVLPGAALASYRALEQRVAATAGDWRITLIPPPAPPPEIGFAADMPDADALATAIWGAQRLGLPLGVSGTRADAVIALLEQAGVAAERVPGTGETVTLRWQPPAAP